VGTGTERPAPDITVPPPLSPSSAFTSAVPSRARARTHTRVALCPVSRTQLGWVSAFNPLGGAPSLSRKACIHRRPPKGGGACVWLGDGLTAVDYQLGRPTPSTSSGYSRVVSSGPASWGSSLGRLGEPAKTNIPMVRLYLLWRARIPRPLTYPASPIGGGD